MYNWVTLLYSRNQQNYINHLLKKIQYNLNKTETQLCINYRV